MAYSSGELGDIQTPLGGSGVEQTSGRQDVDLTGGAGGGSYGGYNGTWVTNPDGTRTFDTTKSGRAASVDRARGLGAAAADRGAYRNDYSLAEIDANNGIDDRRQQGMAAQLARDTALNGDAQSQMLGRNMLQQGLQTQRAAALSTRGGSLAQAAAMRQQQNGQGSFLQQGNNALQAQRADDMASGRAQYMQNMTQMRGLDARAQALHQQQAIEQMKNEIDQRGLNQAGQMGYEEMGQNINKSAQDATLKNYEFGAGVDAAAALRGQRQADRDMNHVGDAAQMGGTLLSGLSGLNDTSGGGPKPSGGGGYSNGIYHDDPYGTSDARAKRGIRSLASASAMRGGR